ncbi:MAG: lysylphosphatidylglycerol synthase transmembrane domain-containing protein [Bacteroidota bacterium]
MNKQVSNILKFLVFFGIGIFLVWLSVRNLTQENKEQIGDALQRADYTWIVVSILVGMLSHISRAIRWKMLLAPLNHHPKTSNTFFAVMVGYFANYAIPRLGEVSRCGILSRYEKIPFTESFGTVIVERLIDVLCFFILVAIVLAVQFKTIYAYLNETLLPGLYNKVSGSSTLLYALLSTGILFMLLAFLFRNRLGSLIKGRARSLLTGFVEGLKTIRRLRSPWLFVFHSLFIWFIYYAMLHICFFCLDETKGLGVGAGLTTLLIATLTVMITPGGLGAYPYAVASILAIYAIDPHTIGTAIGWLVWLSQFVAIVFFGLLSLVLLPLLNKEKHGAENKA